MDTFGQQPVSGAQITPSWDLAGVTSGADGSYTLGAVPSPPANPYKLTVSAPGFITRELWVGWQLGTRTDVTLDIIRDTPPFSIDFYKQLVRGGYDRLDGPWPLQRLNKAPSFYIKTVDQNGKAVEPEVLDVIRDAIGRAVTSFSAGRMSAAAIESGVEVRGAAPGWINVTIERTTDMTQTLCGYANIGYDPGSVLLYEDVCTCGSRKVPGALVMHEIGHAMGFFHVGDTRSVMYPFIPGSCPAGELSTAEKHHVAIAYSRPRGNMDPDSDPSTGKLLRADSGRPIRVVN